MLRGPTGRYQVLKTQGEPVRAFVPLPLPPEPPLELSGALQIQLEQAHLALGRLDSISNLLPDTSLFLYTYVRKEALLSSQIEGTQSSLSDLLLFEIEPGAPAADVLDVSNYVAAMEHGLQRLREGMPLSNRLIREIHARLLARGRGSDKEPGEFRRSQNWIGGARPGVAHFVPPPPDLVAGCMSDLEQFLHRVDTGLPALLRAALAHVQFETIHPFLDGNGRVGRLLITFLLCHARILREPLLYLSLHFKHRRVDYYRLLDGVRTDGDWEAWIAFFLEGIAGTAEGAVAAARRLGTLFDEDRARIRQAGRKASSMLRVHDALKARPILGIADAASRTGLSFPTVASAVDALLQLGVVREITGRQRNRMFAYDRYLEILNEGTEAI
jgi:Fic family protein